MVRFLPAICIMMVGFIAFTSCSEEDIPYVNISTEEILFESDAAQQVVQILSNTQWSAVSGDSWCKLGNSEGKYEGAIQLIVDKNLSTQERSTTVRVQYGDGSANILIRQKGAEAMLELSEDAVEFYRAADETTIVVICNEKWEASSSKEEWCRVLPPGAGDGNGKLTIAVTENTTGKERSAVVSVFTDASGDAMLKNIRVTQKATAPRIVVSPVEKIVGALEEQFSLSILSNVGWIIAADTQWIGLSDASGTGDATVNVTVKSNDTGKERYGHITIMTDDEYEDREIFTVKVTQAPDEYYLEVPAIEYLVNKDGGELGISYLSGGNCVIAAQSAANWIVWNKGKSTGEKMVFDVAENMGNEARSAEVSILTTGQSGQPIIRNATVIQSATDYLIDIVFSDYVLSPEGEVREIEVLTTASDLTVRSNTDWCEIKYDQNTKMITITAPVNASGSKRVAVVDVSLVVESTGERLSKQFTVSQDVSDYEFRFEESVFRIGNDTQSVAAKLISKYAWHVANGADLPNWINVSPMAADGTMIVLVSANANLTSKERSIMIVFEDDITKMTAILSIIQEKGSSTGNKYVGRGYDATGMYASDESVKAQLLDWDELVNDNCVADIKTFNDTYEHKYYGKNSVEYMESLTTSVTASVNALFFSAQATTTFGSKVYGSQETEMGMFTHKTRKNAVYLHENLVGADLIPHLTKEARKDLATMSAEGLIQKYGTHILTGAVIGGTLDYSMAADRSSMRKEVNWSAAIKGGFSKGQIGASVGVEVDAYNSVANSSSNFSETLKVRGGDSQYASGLGSQAAYDSWLASMTDDSKLVLIDYYGSKLIPIWEFIEDATRKAEVKEVMENYIKASCPNLTTTHKTLTLRTTRISFDHSQTTEVFVKSGTTWDFTISPSWADALNYPRETLKTNIWLKNPYYLVDQGQSVTYSKSLSTLNDHDFTLAVDSRFIVYSNLKRKSTFFYDVYSIKIAYDAVQGIWKDVATNTKIEFDSSGKAQLKVQYIAPDGTPNLYFVFLVDMEWK